MAKRRKQADKSEMDQFRMEHPLCWMCLYLGLIQRTKTEVHHIAGRGKRHDVRGNYAALCRTHHEVIQSALGSELFCLVLKRRADPEFYSPELICELRHNAATWITSNDVDGAERLMRLTREAMQVVM